MCVCVYVCRYFKTANCEKEYRVKWNQLINAERSKGIGEEDGQGEKLEMAIPAERIFRFLRRRVAVQYLILRSTRRMVSTNVNYH